MLQTLKRVADRPSNLMTEFFETPCEAEGLIIDRFGKVRTRISVTMSGRWQGEQFRLDEEFRYEDGSRETRVWLVDFKQDGSMSAMCPDLDQELSGLASDDQVNMSYKFPVPIGGTPIKLTFDDRIFRLSEETLLEKVRMTKLGILVAELILIFRKA